MMPLVAHIRASNFYGGPERQIIGHIKTSKNFRHLVITFREGSRKNEFEIVCRKEGINVVAIDTKNAYQWTTVTCLRKLLLKEKIKIICCHGYKPLVLSFLAKRNLSIPVIAFSRGHTSENFKIRIFEFIEHKLYSFSDKIIAVSSGYAKILMARGVDKTKLCVVLNAVEIEKFQPYLVQKKQIRVALGFHEDDFLIATAGRLSPEKAQGDLITAFAMIHHEHRETHLLIFGDGPLRESLENQVERLNVQNVHFMGHRKDLDKIMPILTLFVLPSLTEGLPNVLLEAGSANVPMIATSVGGVPEIIEHEKTGVLVEAGNPHQLSKAIGQCVSNKLKCKKLSETAYQLIENQYGFIKQANLLETIYSDLLRVGTTC